MIAQASCARSESSVTARLRQSAPAMISQGFGRLRLRLRLRYSSWDAGTAAVKAGTGGTGHGCYREKWLRASLGGQGTATAELLTQGTAGRGRMQSGILANPLPCLYRANRGIRKVISAPFRYSQQIWPFWLSCSTKKCEVSH